MSTHVSDPNSRTEFTTALKKVPGVCASSPYLSIILNILNHLLIYFCRLASTAGQSFSEVIKMRSKYLKAVTVIIVQPYSLKSLSVHALASSAISLCRFRSTPLEHWVVLVWRIFRASHGTIMSQQGHRGWRRLPSYMMITVSCM